MEKRGERIFHRQTISLGKVKDSQHCMQSVLGAGVCLSWKQWFAFPRSPGSKNATDVCHDPENCDCAPTCYRAPKPQKCMLKSDKCHVGPPGKMAPKVNTYVQQLHSWDISMGLLFGYFNWLWGHFFRGVKHGICRTLKRTFGASGLCSRLGQLQPEKIFTGGDGSLKQLSGAFLWTWARQNSIGVDVTAHML